MGLKSITSAQNPVIKTLLGIKRRPGKDAFLAEGPHLVEAALSGGAKLGAVVVTNEYMARLEEDALFFKAISHAARGFYQVPEHLFTKLAEAKTPQGILAQCRYEELPLGSLALKGKGSALIVLAAGIREPGNLGALVRAADAAGADACIILSGSANIFSSKAVRATAGSLFHLPVIEAGMEETLDYLEEKKVLLAGADAHADKSLYDWDFKAPVAIAFGEEAHGLPSGLKARAGALLGIPIMGGAESLNVVASAAVFLFEAVRQRSHAGH
ncbi:MAG: RNA methyltransferase [Nitrospiraceae bacterium]|nr:RNA methyltransferase [Nitrospiraceae bacterium]